MATLPRDNNGTPIQVFAPSSIVNAQLNAGNSYTYLQTGGKVVAIVATTQVNIAFEGLGGTFPIPAGFMLQLGVPKNGIRISSSEESEVSILVM